MPSFQPRPRVGFAPTPAYSRPARDDEAYVLRAFSRHASHCDACRDPYAAYQQDQSLCPRGLRRARDVAQYIFSLGADDCAYSLVDRESARQLVRIELPRGCDAASVRGLLRAMQQGLEERVGHGPPASYDRTYYVPPRTSNAVAVTPESRRRRVHIEQPEDFYRQRSSDSSLASSSSGASLRDEKLRSYRGKGSGYAKEMKEREQHLRTKQPVYYRVQRQDGAPPVPTKDWI